MAIPPKLAAAGVTAADYEMPGLLSWTRPPVPDVPVNFRGGSTFGNYVRKYPDLMADFLSNKDKHGMSKIAEYGRHHWKHFGLLEAATASTSGVSAGLPMPDVPGYKYEYPKYTWRSAGGGEAGAWEEAGTEADIDKYPYYPYFPGSMGDEIRDDDDKVVPHMLVGVRLIKE